VCGAFFQSLGRKIVHLAARPCGDRKYVHYRPCFAETAQTCVKSVTKGAKIYDTSLVDSDRICAGTPSIRKSRKGDFGPFLTFGRID
jgi:hypothetical protein